MPELDTPKGETEVKTVTEPEATPSAPVTDKPEEETDYKALFEAEKASKAKVEMERNNLKNKIADAETAALKEKEDYKALYEKAQADLKAREDAENEQKQVSEAEQFRKDFIAEQPKELQTILNALIEAAPHNFLWKDAQTWDDARAQLEKQAAVIAKVNKIDLTATGDEEDEDVTIHGNNPSQKLDVDMDKFANMSADEMRKLLPKAPIR